MGSFFKKKPSKKRTKSVIDFEVERCKKEACEMIDRLDKLISKNQKQQVA